MLLMFVAMAVFFLVYVGSVDIEIPQVEKRIMLSNSIFKKLLNSSQDMEEE